MNIWVAMAILVPLFIVLYFYGNKHKGQKKDIIAVCVYGVMFIGIMISTSFS